MQPSHYFFRYPTVCARSQHRADLHVSSMHAVPTIPTAVKYQRTMLFYTKPQNLVVEKPKAIPPTDRILVNV